MKPNMGFIDRIVRALVAIAVGVLYLTGQISGVAAMVLGAVAIVLLATGMVGFCPLYVPLHLKTLKS